MIVHRAHNRFSLNRIVTGLNLRFTVQLVLFGLEIYQIIVNLIVFSVITPLIVKGFQCEWLNAFIIQNGDVKPVKLHLYAKRVLVYYMYI